MTQEEKLIIDTYTSGLTMQETADKLNLGFKKVRGALKRNNIPNNSKKGKPNPKNQRVLTKEEEELVCKIYKETHRIKDCEKAIHSGQNVVRRCLQKYNLYKTHAEAVAEAGNRSRKYNINDSFFDTENSTMAYILGFIAADGTVRKNCNEIKIGLSAVDADFLQQFQKLIGGSELKYYTTTKGYDSVSWTFTSQHIKKKLAEYNIVPQKTFTFKFPKNLNKKYWIDFIRGYFDGDGSISTAGPSAIRWQLCSATTDVLETIVNFFYEEYGIPKVSIQKNVKNRKNPLYNIQYSSISTRKIYEFLYTDNCIYLPRKKQKYEEILQRNKIPRDSLSLE